MRTIAALVMLLTVGCRTSPIPGGGEAGAGGAGGSGGTGDMARTDMAPECLANGSLCHDDAECCMRPCGKRFFDDPTGLCGYPAPPSTGAPADMSTCGTVGVVCTSDDSCCFGYACIELNDKRTCQMLLFRGR